LLTGLTLAYILYQVNTITKFNVLPYYICGSEIHMQNYLTLNIALTPDRLRATAEMLAIMADSIPANAAEALIADLNAGKAGADNAAEVFRTPPGVTAAAPAAPAAPSAPAAPAAADDENEIPAGQRRFIGHVEVDSEDLPHDSRIHADSKKFLAKTGQWKLKRNMPEDTVAKVKAELKLSIDALKAGGAKVTSAPVGAAPAAPSAPAAPAPEAPKGTFTPLDLSPPAPPAAAAPAAPSAPAAPAGAAAPGAVPANLVSGDVDADFARIVQRITNSIAAKKFGVADVQKMYTHFGAGSVPAMKLNPAKFTEIHQYLDMLDMGLPPQ
jgi:hypothetical protein